MYLCRIGTGIVAKFTTVETTLLDFLGQFVIMILEAMATFIIVDRRG
jgi:hypothetical protein